MSASSLNLRSLREALAGGVLSPSKLAKSALNCSNGNTNRNTFLWQDAAWTEAEAAHAESMPRSSGGVFSDGRSQLWGIPVSVKDCFDLAGAPTSCGVPFYRDLHGPAARDSWVVEKLRANRRGYHWQNAPPSFGLRNYRREPRFWRLRPTRQSRCTDWRILKRGSGQCARRLCGCGNRDRHGRLDPSAGRTVRYCRLSSLSRPGRLARGRASGAVL